MKQNFSELWNAFLRWNGWKACAGGWYSFLHWAGWRRLLRWKHWKTILLPHPLWILPLAVSSAAGLGWVFLNSREQHPLAYGVYCLSAYTLTVLCVRMPALVKGILNFLHSDPLARKILSSNELRFRLGLYLEQLINFGYGIFKCVFAWFAADPWMGTDGFYNLVQSIIQLIQILQRRKELTLEQQWRRYRLVGFLVFILHLSTTGIAFLMIHDHMYEEYPGYMIFVTAAFAFYKLINAFIDVARDRKHKAPIDSSVRLLDLSQAMFSLFSLQVAMIHAFGGTPAFEGLMNTLTGSAVSVLTIGTGIYMLRRSRRALHELTTKEDLHGPEAIL